MKGAKSAWALTHDKSHTCGWRRRASGDVPLGRWRAFGHPAGADL